MTQSKRKANAANRLKARENIQCGQVRIGCGFIPDWMTERYEFREPFVKRSNAETKQLRITFNTQVKTTLLAIPLSYNVRYDWSS